MADRSASAQIKLQFQANGLAASLTGLKNLTRALINTELSIENVETAFRNLEDVGASMTDIANAVIEPMTRLSEQYTQRFGIMEATSTRWLKSTMKLEQAQLRMGRAATQALQPLRDKMVDTIEALADFIEQNPELLKLAVGAAGSLLAAGTAIAGISKAVAAINQLRSAMRALSATQGLMGGVANIGATGALVSAGAVFGNQIAKAMAPFIDGLDDAAKAQIAQSDIWDAVASGLELVAIGVYKLNHTIIDLEKGMVDLAANIAKSTIDFAANLHLISKQDAEASKASIEEFADNSKELIDVIGQLRDARNADFFIGASTKLHGASDAGVGGNELDITAGITQDMLDQYEFYLLEIEQSTQQFEFQMEQQRQDHYRQMIMMEQDYERQERQAREDFERDMQMSREDFDHQNTIAERDFRKDRSLAEEEYRRDEMQRLADHYLERQRAEEDHKRTILDAAARLDALGVIQEQRQYAIDSKRAEADFKKETATNQANFARQQKLAQEQFDLQQRDAKDNYDRQRRIAEDNYRIMQRRAREEFEIQRRRAADEFAYQMRTQQRQFDMELQLRAESYRRQTAMQLRLYTMTERQAESHYNRLRRRFLGFLSGLASAVNRTPDSRVSTGTASGAGTENPDTYQLGGYTGSGGMGILHAGEFVLNPGTTRAMESRLGGRLTQQNVLGAGGLGGITLQMTNVFENVGAHSIDALTQMVKSGTREALKDVLQSYKESV